MTVLRSPDISPLQNPSPSITLKNGLIIEPSIPSKTTETLEIQATHTPNLILITAPRRSSFRLSSQSNFENFSNDSCSKSGTKRQRNRTIVNNLDENDSNDFNSLVPILLDESSIRVSDCEEMVEEGSKKEKEESGYSSLRSGVKVAKNVYGASEIDGRKEKGNDVLIEGDADFDMEGIVDGLSVKNEELKSLNRIFTREEKGKGMYYDLGFDLNYALDMNFDVEGELGSEMRAYANEIEDDTLSLNQKDEELSSPKRFSREEKGKSVMVERGFDLNTVDMEFADDFDVGSEIGGVVDDKMDDDVIENVVNLDHSKMVMERFKNIARRNASKFAFFDFQEEGRDQVNAQVEGEMGGGEPVENVEDCPGPFSTAMKIVRDRKKNLNGQVQNLSSVKGSFPLVSWTPRKEKLPKCLKRAVPSLVSLCVDILVVNVDAISSLRCVPDAIRNTISRKLCDSRKMNPHFLSLLLDGSPSEIRLADCSWLEESIFEKSFEACETKLLTVLQLDLGGHCVSDSSLRKALVPKGLEALTTISLKGACRISDVGLAALVSTAPKLRSINLSQCSLLTAVGIESITNSLGSILQELYLDDCDTLDAMRILPSLKRLKCLEVLSLKGIASVSDKFIRELIDENGQNMKELVLGNCVNLTDFSLKIIAEKCSQLCVLDLSFLGKLTDIGMAYLANGCHGIQYLKIDRCPFSDDAISAFLETSGVSLNELSLNNIKKVGQNTAISLAKRCKNLESLDLSWCRCLTDEALGLIADSCLSLRLLKIFGCTQVTSVFVDGHSNPHLQIIGLKLTPILNYIKRPEFQQGPLHCSAVPPS